jgi:hypothetical protein
MEKTRERFECYYIYHHPNYLHHDCISGNKSQESPPKTSATIRNLTATSRTSANCDFRPLSWNNCPWFPTICGANLLGYIYLQGTCSFASQLPFSSNMSDRHSIPTVALPLDYQQYMGPM